MRVRKLFLILFLAFSLSGVSSCAAAPLMIPTCVADVALNGFDCVDPRTDKQYFIPFDHSDGGIFFQGADAEQLLRSCKK